MNYKELEEHLLSFNEATLAFPFDETTAVFKVAKKMFALVGIDNTPLSINLKCDPEDAILLRSQFDAIIPGYHMNKDHWNTIMLDGSLDRELILKLIDDSYKLVVGTLSKTQQKRLGMNQ